MAGPMLPGRPPMPPMPRPGGAPGAMPPVPPSPGAAESMTGPGAGGPLPSPMATPQNMPGMEKSARIQVQIASQMLQRELPHFPLDSEQFKALSSALSTIQKSFGKTEDEDRKLFPAEIMSMLAAVGPGAMSPGQRAMAGGPPPGAGGPPPGAGGPPPGAGGPPPGPGGPPSP